MKQRIGGIVLGALLVSQLAAQAELQNVEINGGRGVPEVIPVSEPVLPAPNGIDLRFLERYALSEDRAAIVEELVPGTEGYYYFSCLYNQEIGKFDAVDTLLEAWVDRFGPTPHVQEIRHRQALLRYTTEPDKTREYLTSHFGLYFGHQRQVPGEAPDLPTALDPSLLNREAFRKRVAENPGYNDTVQGFTPRAYDWLVRTELSPTQLRGLLSELRLPDYPNLPALIAQDLDAPRSNGFGSLEIHELLTRAQLDALLRAKPDLLAADVFIRIYMQRLVPGNDNADWRRDPDIMRAYLERLEEFAQRLAPAQSSLKAHVRYHRLAFDRDQGIYDRERFLQYVKMPRIVDYANPDFMKRAENAAVAADLRQSVEGATVFEPVRSDETLIGDYLRHFFVTDKGYDAYAPYIREDYLRRIFAETKLLQGEGDMEQWYSWLDPATVDALKNRVDVAFVSENKQRFALDEAVTIDVWVKNVDRLLVKVFEIDTQSYYEKFKHEINTAIDLDGLVANHEQVYTYSETPLHRVRRQFSFPELAGRGIWVIEFVGNGTSSRAVVAKGALHYLQRTGPAGPSFTVFDESGTKLPTASLWFSGRSYTADENGEITLPFSTNPGTQQFLLRDGDFASLAEFFHVGESYRLSTGFHVDTESLRSGQMATVALRPALYLNDTLLPLNLMKQVVLQIRSRTHDGIESSQQITEPAMAAGELTVLPFRVPENLAELQFKLSATVDKLTGGEPVSLQEDYVLNVNGIHQTQQTAALLLTRSAAGYAVEIRDKTGLPLGDRGVYFTFTHRDFTDAYSLELKTDAAGRIALGALQDINLVSANTAGFSEARWGLGGAAYTYPRVLQGSTREELTIPFLGDRSANVAEVASLLETNQGIYVADRSDALTLSDGYLSLSELQAGDYMLHLKDNDERITVRITDGEAVGSLVASKSRVLEGQTPTALQIQSVTPESDGLKIQVGGANALTRVHVVATRFLPDQQLYSRLYRAPTYGEAQRSVGQGYALYTSGRQIGDEYRYILERRFATKYPGNMLERPSLLLNPWAIQDTEASQEDARGGDAIPAVSPAPSPSVAPDSDAMGHEMRESMGAIHFSPDFDFLDDGTAAFYNLVPDENGVVTLKATDLHGRSHVQIVVTDPFATVSQNVALEEKPWTPRDRRLASALDLSSHVVEQKRAAVLQPGTDLSVSLTGDADVQVYDTVASVYGLFSTLVPDERLKAFRFIAQWPTLRDEEKVEKFSAFESHELNLFLYHKDRPFFDATVRPFLANKYQKTFMDQWLLEEDLRAYLQPWRMSQLNVVEKILLAKRLPEGQAAIVRSVRDGLDMLLPNPAQQNFLFMTALNGSALGGGGSAGGDGVSISGAIRIRGNFYDNSDQANTFFAAPGNGGRDPGVNLAAESVTESMADVAEDRSAPARTRRKMKDNAAEAKALLAQEDVAAGLRQLYIALYRAPEVTQALVETDYYKRTIHGAHANMIAINPFWLDYAKAETGVPFLSEHLAEAASTYTEALLALAVLDLPFEAAGHEVTSGVGTYMIHAGGVGVAFYKDIETAKAASEETPLLVSQNYFRLDDRFRYDGNQQFDKFVTEEFLTGVAYGCQVTVTNPASTPYSIDVLRQIPAGAVPVNGGRFTKSEGMSLEAYSTTRLEYFFYFPKTGTFDHYPVHASKDGEMLAFAVPRQLVVVDVPSSVDNSSWDYVSQQGSPEAVLDFLKENNLNRIDLGMLQWRMKDQGFYRQVIDLLNARLVYTPELWAYAIYHDDRDAISTFLQHRADFTAQAGPVLESALLTIEPVDRKSYQHIEYAPLINPRAHNLDGKWMITNAQLAEQYTTLMMVLAHRKELRAEDQLALTYYLLLQDRVDEAIAYFGQLAPNALATRVQYDYLQAYLAFYTDNPAAAATIAEGYREYPVTRWQKRFAEVAAQAAQIIGANSDTSPGDGLPSQDALATSEPQLDLAVNPSSLTVHYQNLTACTVSFYPIDLEMLFTRNPFDLARSNVFAGVKPIVSQTVTLDEATNQVEIPLPEGFAQRHVVIKVEGAGISRSDIRYASSLTAQLIARYGQVHVNDQVTNQPLARVYVKVFARMKDGAVQFYRDGYTDLRGRFDYASSSTLDIGQVNAFALLVLSEDNGAKVLNAEAPTR